MATEIGPGVIVLETSVAGGKTGVIAGTRVALAVDAGVDDAEGEAVSAAARSLDRESTRLVYTHGHADHVLGGAAFIGHEILAGRGVPAHMAEQLDAWASRGRMTRQELEGRLGWPTVVVEGDVELDLGNRPIHLLDTPGHAPGSVCVFDPSAGLIFGGDTIVTAIPPAFADGDSLTLERTLRRLAELQSEILVPGHGPVVQGADAVRQAITWSADYLAQCREHVAMNVGRDRESIIESASFDTLTGGRLRRDRYRMEWRLQQTIRGMLDELGRGAD